MSDERAMNLGRLLTHTARLYPDLLSKDIRPMLVARGEMGAGQAG
jgi:hypothetical protein